MFVDMLLRRLMAAQSNRLLWKLIDMNESINNNKINGYVDQLWPQ